MKKNIEIRSDEVQEVLSSVPNSFIRWGNTIIVIVFTILFLISIIIQYPDEITCEVKLTSQDSSEKITVPSNGRLIQLNVKNNQWVEHNTYVGIIENSANHNDVLLVKKKIKNLDINKIEAFKFENQKYTLGEVQDVFNKFEKSFNDYLLFKKLNKNQIENLGLQTNSKSLNRNYKLSQKNLIFNKEQLRLKKEELNRFKTLFEKGILSKNEWENRNSEFLEFEKSLKSSEIEVENLKSNIEGNSNIKTIINLENTKNELDLKNELIQSLNNLNNSIIAWEKKYILKNKIAGKINFINPLRTNDFLNQGDIPIIITPKLYNTTIYGFASSHNIGKLKKAQKALISLRKFPTNEFGKLIAEVESISNFPNKEQQYLVIFKLKNNKTSYNKNISLVGEMDGEANIVVDKKSLFCKFIDLKNN